MKTKKIHVILFEPEIAGNVGTIMRTCVAANAVLHLIEPLGFFLDNRFVKRASANYMDKLEYYVYDDLADFYTKHKDITIYYSTRYGKSSHSDINFKKCDKEIWVMYGKESTGIPKKVLADHIKYCFRLPMSGNVRCLNVSNVVSIVTYEILRQLDYQGLSSVEIQKGEEWLTK